MSFADSTHRRVWLLPNVSAVRQQTALACVERCKKRAENESDALRTKALTAGGITHKHGAILDAMCTALLRRACKQLQLSAEATAVAITYARRYFLTRHFDVPYATICASSVLLASKTCEEHRPASHVAVAFAQTILTPPTEKLKSIVRMFCGPSDDSDVLDAVRELLRSVAKVCVERDEITPTRRRMFHKLLLAVCATCNDVSKVTVARDAVAAFLDTKNNPNDLCASALSTVYDAFVAFKAKETSGPLFGAIEKFCSAFDTLDADILLSEMRQVSVKAMLRGEVRHVLDAQRFSLTVHTPFVPLQAFLHPLKTSFEDPPLVEKVRTASEHFLMDIMATDVIFSLPPSQLALVALRAACRDLDKEDDSNLLPSVDETVTSLVPGDNVVQTADEIEREVRATPSQLPDTAFVQLRKIKRRAHLCYLPEETEFNVDRDELNESFASTSSSVTSIAEKRPRPEQQPQQQPQQTASDAQPKRKRRLVLKRPRKP